MATANSSINITELDFDSIKSNFKTYLKSKDGFNDYNFESSTISTILDLLAYNTHYNAYYLNMVANEMFMDTALKRSSVVSHAKLLDYTPKSTKASTAMVNVTFRGTSAPTFTIPKYTRFYSEALDNVNYPFVTLDSTTVKTANNIAAFSNVVLTQGILVRYSFTVDSAQNPSRIFTIPDINIDISSLLVYVYDSAQSTNYVTYTSQSSHLELNSTSPVYFIQESLAGEYEIYFGDGIIGTLLPNNSVVVIEYIVAKGSMTNGIQNYTLMDSIGVYTSVTITSTQIATNGQEKESIASIKYQAIKSYAAQNRAVSESDYATLIQQNTMGYNFDAVSVWGGEDNIPPTYGSVFISIKPKGSYVLSDIAKQKIISDILKPLSVMTVSPQIIDPDYIFIKFSINVSFNQHQTVLTQNQLKNLVIATTQQFGRDTLNTFNSKLQVSKLASILNNLDPAIIASEISIEVQKKIYPTLLAAESYQLHFDTELQKSTYLSGVNTYPSIILKNLEKPTESFRTGYVEELPQESSAIATISIINPGFSYSKPPTIIIIGDGVGATASSAIIPSTGAIRSITVTASGSGYTEAAVKIIPDITDTTGQMGLAIVNLENKFGKLRLSYTDTNKVRNTYADNIGRIDYNNGIIYLDAFSPMNIDNMAGILTVSVKPKTTLISSSRNRIITLDPFDPNAIVVNLIPN